MSQDFDLQVFNTQMQMATAFSKSGILPPSLRGKPNDIVIVLQLAKELNLPPMQAINGINVIQGKPTISPQLMLAMIYKNYPDMILDIKEDEKNKSVTVKIAKNKDDSFHESTWNADKAKSMGLIGKDNWQKQFMTMCKWRAVSEVVRTKFPHVIMGLYTPEELDSKDQYVYDAQGEVVAEKNKPEFKETIVEQDEQKRIAEKMQQTIEEKKNRPVDYYELFRWRANGLVGENTGDDDLYKRRWLYLKEVVQFEKDHDKKDTEYWKEKYNLVEKIQKIEVDQAVES